MTTEVLRNMLYAGSHTLRGLGYVVMDEVHYLADRFRGAVWEEVIIHLPESVRLVSLSATVSATPRSSATGCDRARRHRVIVEEHRPVPLWQHVLVGSRLYDLFVDDARRATRRSTPSSSGSPATRLRTSPRNRRDAPRQARRSPRPRRIAIAEPGRRRSSGSTRDGLLPAITFIFSRAGCDAAVQQCLHADLRLTTPRRAPR